MYPSESDSHEISDHEILRSNGNKRKKVYMRSSGNKSKRCI